MIESFSRKCVAFSLFSCFASCFAPSTSWHRAAWNVWDQPYSNYVPRFPFKWGYHFIFMSGRSFTLKQLLTLPYFFFALLQCWPGCLPEKHLFEPKFLLFLAKKTISTFMFTFVLLPTFMSDNSDLIYTLLLYDIWYAAYVRSVCSIINKKSTHKKDEWKQKHEGSSAQTKATHFNKQGNERQKGGKQENRKYKCKKKSSNA